MLGEHDGDGRQGEQRNHCDYGSLPGRRQPAQGLGGGIGAQNRVDQTALVGAGRIAHGFGNFPPPAAVRDQDGRRSEIGLHKHQRGGKRHHRQGYEQTQRLRDIFNPETVQWLDAQVWGQAFEPPMFSDVVDIVAQRLVGEKHLKLTVKHGGALRDAIWFGRVEPVPERVMLAYRLAVDEYNGRVRVQMVVEGASAA